MISWKYIFDIFDSIWYDKGVIFLIYVIYKLIKMFKVYK